MRCHMGRIMGCIQAFGYVLEMGVYGESHTIRASLQATYLKLTMLIIHTLLVYSFIPVLYMMSCQVLLSPQLPSLVFHASNHTVHTCGGMTSHSQR